MITRIDTIPDDPYSLDGASYGLMNWNYGVSGRAMMAGSEKAGALDAKTLTVMAKTENDEEKLFVPNSSDITIWTFENAKEDLYYLSAQADGAVKYLKIGSTGLSLVDEGEKDDTCRIQVIPGSGSRAGQISLKANGKTLTYSGNLENGFNTSGAAGSEWLYLVEESELTEEYFLTYTADKVSVSDPDRVTNAAKIIVYTRSWNERTKQYEFYAVDSDGRLVRVYESGDSIQWVGSLLNNMLWDFTEYYWEGTTDPNYFYELYNEYSQKYISPQLNGSQVLAGNPIGVNLNGRRNGAYYSSILAWDPESYAYAGLKVENGQLVSCPVSEADDFYFAIVKDIPVDDDLSSGVPTIDNTQHGITMKIVNFADRTTMSSFLGNNDGGMGTMLHQGLLSTYLGSDGYPTAKKGSLGSLYSQGGLKTVNHLFIASTYYSSGYYEFDSSQNFATLQGNNFKVYEELGTYDSGGDKPSLKHGQFFPFNDLKAGTFASTNGKNLYTATGELLSDGNPRKNERLYTIEYDKQKADCFFGVEIEASFTQTPSGLDAWGHDIIYEFTGDDDFWLYVDGELVIDLGGIHSAVPGNVNFATGDVNVNGMPTTLYDIFRRHYAASHPDKTEAEIRSC